jgi:hypothetical protein
VRPPGFEPGSSAFRPLRVGRLMSYQTRLRPLRNVSNALTTFISFRRDEAFLFFFVPAGKAKIIGRQIKRKNNAEKRDAAHV